MGLLHKNVPSKAINGFFFLNEQKKPSQDLLFDKMCKYRFIIQMLIQLQYQLFDGCVTGITGLLNYNLFFASLAYCLRGILESSPEFYSTVTLMPGVFADCYISAPLS